MSYVSARLETLRRMATLLCGDAHRADDVVQETITKLYVHWPRIGGVENLDAYVRTMLLRTFLDERRRGWWRRVRLTGESPDRPAAAAGDPEDRVVLRAALAAVPARQRAVLILRFLYDLSVAEVADMLGCTEGTVKSQTSHGLAAIRRRLGATTLVEGGVR